MDERVDWRPWGEQALSEARNADKPILLAIGAVWCHWCHVMDRTSYSDAAVIATIGERYVPVRVDTDERPDVNARYNMGGWPTTAILTPGGELMTGATYLPPEQMRIMLEQVADAYATRKSEILRSLEERFAQFGERQAPDGAALDPSIVTATREAIEGLYDDEYGGFGSEPKFPQTEVLEFLVLLDRRQREGRLDAMLSKTLLAMARGGMYDHVEGGFFRYSTTRDWTIPHFEKMSEDHAGLIRAYARGWRLLGIASLRETLLSAVGYVRTVLCDPATGLFAGSQDADEAYYALGLAERRARCAPYVDRTVYTKWNAGLASAFAVAGAVLDDDTLIGEAAATLDAIDEELRDPRGLCFHYRKPGQAPQLPTLLVDQTAYLRALLDVHEVSGEPRFRERALALEPLIDKIFGDGQGTFVDHVNAEPLGRLAIRNAMPAENASFADSLLRLAAMTGEDAYAERATRTLQAFSQRYAALR
ncbi:MAG: thioredoxin domain-containing protein, partial [Vulcanimicrobiaceae bacterium]